MKNQKKRESSHTSSEKECEMGAAKGEEGMNNRPHKLSDSVQCYQI